MDGMCLYLLYPLLQETTQLSLLTVSLYNSDHKAICEDNENAVYLLMEHIETLQGMVIEIEEMYQCLEKHKARLSRSTLGYVSQSV